MEELGERRQSPSYFQTKKKYYDPFSFQSTKKSTPVSQYIENTQKNKDVFLNRLDSRFSIPVIFYSIKIVKLLFWIFRNPIMLV